MRRSSRLLSAVSARLGRLAGVLDPAVLAWWLLLIAGGSVVVVATVLGIFPRAPGGIALTVVMLGAGLAAVGAITGHSVVSLAAGVRRRLRRWDKGGQWLVAVALLVVLACGVFLGVRTWVLGPDRRVVSVPALQPGKVVLPAAAEPREIRATRSGTWLGDNRDYVLTYVDQQGAVKQFPVPGAGPIAKTIRSYGVPWKLAADGSGNAWTVVDTGTGHALVGLAPSGNQLRRIAVPDVDNLVIDSEDRAWMTRLDVSPAEDEDGSTLYVVRADLKSGEVREFNPFPDLRFKVLGDVGLTADPLGRAWLLAQSRDQSGDATFLSLRLNGGPLFQERPIRWPRGLRPPLDGTAWAVDASQTMWIAYTSGVARIDMSGSVTTMPVAFGMKILQLHALPSGRIGLVTTAGPNYRTQAVASFGASEPQYFVATFDPRTDQFPSVQRVSVDDPDVAGTPNGLLLVPAPKEHALLVLRAAPATLPASAAVVRRIDLATARLLTTLRAAENEEVSGKRPWQHVIDDAVAALTDGARELDAAASDDQNTVDPRLVDRLEKTTTVLRAVIPVLSELAAVPESTSGYFFAYGTMRSQAQFALDEARAVVGLRGLSRDGTTRWQATATPDV